MCTAAPASALGHPRRTSHLWSRDQSASTDPLLAAASLQASEDASSGDPLDDLLMEPDFLPPRTQEKQFFPSSLLQAPAPTFLDTPLLHLSPLESLDEERARAEAFFAGAPETRHQMNP